MGWGWWGREGQMAGVVAQDGDGGELERALVVGVRKAR